MCFDADCAAGEAHGGLRYDLAVRAVETVGDAEDGGEARDDLLIAGRQCGEGGVFRVGHGFAVVASDLRDEFLLARRERGELGVADHRCAVLVVFVVIDEDADVVQHSGAAQEFAFHGLSSELGNEVALREELVVEGQGKRRDVFAVSAFVAGLGRECTHFAQQRRGVGCGLGVGADVADHAQQ